MSKKEVCDFCGKPAYKTDGQCRTWCYRCFNPIKQPMVNIGPSIGRNDTCPCGSGMKYKKCCINKTKEHEQERTEGT